MKKLSKHRIIAILTIFIASIVSASLLYLYFFSGQGKVEYVKYTQFIESVENGSVSRVNMLNGNKIEFYTEDNDITYTTDNPKSVNLKEQLLLKGIEVKEENSLESSYIFSTLFFISAAFTLYRIRGRNTSIASTASAKSKSLASTQKECTFSDIAGNEEAKESVKDIVDFIKQPHKYAKYGAKMPSGVIFYGPPGTGKTLMAKAIAGECGVPFFAVSGSDFVQMYVGVGAGRVRDLFKKARSAGKAVIFIDEIDALGKKRSNSPNGGNDEREQTLNALLTEMSGFNGSEGIVVIAATNRLDTLDEALLRAGRFDRQIEINLPDLNARKSILKYHAKNKPLGEDVNIDSLAKETVFFSGAMLENLLNEAAIIAANNEADKIVNEHVQKAYYTIIAGSEKKDRSNIKDRERRITAFHEAGHALSTKLLLPETSVSKITIIPSTKGAAGFCVNVPPEKMYYTKNELEKTIIVSFSGRAAEEIVFGEDNITTGASNDIEKATNIIKDYVLKFGMSKTIGLLNANALNSKEESVLNECYIIANKLYEQAKQILSKNYSTLENIANALIAKEVLCEEELDKIVFN